MRPPATFVRPLLSPESQALTAGFHSPDAFTLRRCQILLASARGHSSATIAGFIGCTPQAVRDAVRAFHAEGLKCLTARSHAPKTTHPVWPRDRDEELRELLRQTPRAFGKTRSLWTLALIAEVCFEQKKTERKLSAEAVRAKLVRMTVTERSKLEE